MEREPEAPRCANQVHLAPERGRSEPMPVCSCPAGLVHMHDCPVAMGLRCVHFQPLGDPPAGLPFAEYERLHEALMGDYLSRTYFHRIRRLAPEGHSWQRRREEIAQGYEAAGDAPAEPGPAEAEEDAEYERERERLIERRKEREALRQEREEKTREERAQERARMGIKTVVEKARETVAQQGNVMESVLDGVELPAPSRRRRRRRGGGGGGGAGAGGGGAAAGGEGAAAGGEGAAPEGQPPAPRRRRRRRRGRGEPPPSSPGPSQGPAPGPA